MSFVNQTNNYGQKHPNKNLIFDNRELLTFANMKGETNPSLFLEIVQ